MKLEGIKLEQARAKAKGDKLVRLSQELRVESQNLVEMILEDEQEQAKLHAQRIELINVQILRII